MVVSVALTLMASEREKPAVAKAPLTADEIAVYNAFLNFYDNGSPGVRNLGNRTTLLELSEGDKKDCLSGLQLQLSPASPRTVHVLEAEMFEGKNVRLVDPKQQNALVRKNDPSRAIFRQGKSVNDAVESAFANGLLEISEIAFDSTRQFAVMSYSFFCGGLCGHGGPLVFQRTGEGWKASQRRCGTWISQASPRPFSGQQAFGHEQERRKGEVGGEGG